MSMSGAKGEFAKYAGNKKDSAGPELAEELVSPSSEIRAAFPSDLSAIELSETPPKDRYQLTGSWFRLMSEEDLPFQSHVKDLIQAGKIKPNSFIILDTGHNIPIAQIIACEMDAQGSFVFPEDDLHSGSIGRVQSQTQTWGEEIQTCQIENNADGTMSIAFLGVDFHRQSDFNIENLPGAEDLVSLGLDKVVYFAETVPEEEMAIERAQKDIAPYLNHLKDSGFDVEVMGVDVRNKKDVGPCAGPASLPMCTQYTRGTQ